MSSVHAFFVKIQLFEGRDLKTPIFWKNCLKFSEYDFCKPGMYFINIGTPRQARNKLPTIWSFFRFKYTICALSSLLLRIVGRMHCELGLTLEHCYNIVRNTLILNMTKSGFSTFWPSNSGTAKTNIDDMVLFYRDVHI